MSKNYNKTQLQVLLGKRIVELRKNNNLSLRQLAQRCDLDFSDISKYEKGEVNIQLSTVYELAKGLNIHPKELFDFVFNINE